MFGRDAFLVRQKALRSGEDLEIRMKKLFLAAALAIAPAATFAQAAPAPAPAPAVPAALPDADPALWVVRDDDTTVYLFGTFHMLDERPWFNDEVRTAFDASGELVVEAIVPDNPAAIQPLIIRFAVDPQGRLLSQRLSAEDNAKLNAALASMGVPAGAFEPLEPWFVSMSMGALVGQRMGIRAENGPEAALRRAAAERNLPVHELEGMEFQLSLFDRMPEEQQLAQLRQAVDSVPEMPALLGRMLAAWSSGDVEGLGAILRRSLDEDPALHRILFTDRNATWAGWIQERMARPGTVFIAVGAGHLAGSDSVQAVLAARGLRSERMPHVETLAPSPPSGGRTQAEE
jgi:uncharacterized protein YbaP (TraB family)